ncbi:MAG: hypothetical protein PHE73_02475 [Sulfurovaceae bacterium]|nr:hypothetical protein [Sulfurovaceae bacterium]
MKKIILSILLFSFFAFAQTSEKLVATPLKLTKAQELYIAQKVSKNEILGRDIYLVHWNDGEDFASLGIGHFIWFPAGHTEKFREVFPMVLSYMKDRNISMPSWLTPTTPFPWNTKKEFYEAKTRNDKQYQELFNFLQSTKDIQAGFLVDRLFKALPQILNTIDDPKKAAMIEERFNKILYNRDGSLNEHGAYVLTDYVNFKGEGTLPSERYNNQGWGLLQALENMDPKESDRFKAFSDSAKAMLSRRIANSPKARGEERWRIGWNKRLDTYLMPRDDNEK